MKYVNKNRNRRGASLAILALSVVALCAVAALAVDEGMMWYTRNKAQMVADSAALAWAGQNSATTRDAVISAYNTRGAAFTLNTAKTTSTATTFTVYGSIASRPIFGGVFGRTSTTVPAHATVTLSPAGTVSDAVPWGIVADQPNPDPGIDPAVRADLIFANSLLAKPPANFTYQTTEITLKSIKMSGSTISTMGNFGSVDLANSSGANDYRTNIAYNSSQPISIGSTIATLPGDKVGPTQQGMSDRLDPSLSPPNGLDSTFVNSASPYNDWFYGRSTYPAGTDPYQQDVKDDHLAVIPLITTPGKNGKADVTVLGLAVFFIENTNPSGGSQNVVTGRFVGVNVPGIAGGSAANGTAGGATVVTLSD